MTQSENPSPPPPPPDSSSDANAAPDAGDTGEQLVLTSPEDARTPRDFALWAGVILLAALTVFSKPLLQGAFIWDDDRYVEQNRTLHQGAQGLANIWTKFGASRGGTIQYYPLTFTTFWLEYQLFGGGVWPPQPGSAFAIELHVTNVILHALAAILLWFVLRQLRVPGAWVIAAIWAIHPLQTESVAWISERKNVLAGVFFSASIWAYLRSGFGFRVSGFGSETETISAEAVPFSSPEPRTPIPATRDLAFYALSFVLFLCAMLSKTVACSMPAVVLLLLWWKRGRLSGRDIVATLPFFVVGAALAAVTSHLETSEAGVGATGAEWNLTWPQRLLVAGRAVWFYAGKNLWPARLTFIYPRWDVAAAPAWHWVFPVAVVVVLLVLFLLRKRIGRGPFVAAAIFVGTLVPALGFFDYYPMRYSFVADHFQYLAGPALIALVVAAVAVLLRRLAAGAEAAPYALAGVVLVVLAVLSVMQSGIYVGQLALWKDTVEKNPSAWMAHHNYGMALVGAEADFRAAGQPELEAKTRDLAYSQFKQAVELKPDHDKAWTAMGNVMLERGDPTSSIPLFDRALKVNPDNVDAMTGRGAALYQLKQYDNSLAAYQQALAYAEQHKQEVPRPKAALIFLWIGKNQAAKGDLKSAMANYNRAIQIWPEEVNARLELAAALAKTGDPAAAAVVYHDVIVLQPNNMAARLGLAGLMMDVGNLAGAQVQLGAAAQINRNDPQLQQAAVRFYHATTQRAAATQPTTASATPPASRGAASPPATTITTTAPAAPSAPAPRAAPPRP